MSVSYEGSFQFEDAAIALPLTELGRILESQTLCLPSATCRTCAQDVGQVQQGLGLTHVGLVNIWEFVDGMVSST